MSPSPEAKSMCKIDFYYLYFFSVLQFFVASSMSWWSGTVVERLWPANFSCQCPALDLHLTSVLQLYG